MKKKKLAKSHSVLRMDFWTYPWWADKVIIALSPTFSARISFTEQFKLKMRLPRPSDNIKFLNGLNAPNEQYLKLDYNKYSRIECSSEGEAQFSKREYSQKKLLSNVQS